jgi:hypothetical protein
MSKLALVSQSKCTSPLVLVAAALSFGVAGIAQAQIAPNSREPLALDAYALRGAQDQSAKLYLSIVAQNGQTVPEEQFGPVQVTVRSPDGQLQSSTSYPSVSAPNGQALIDLGDVPLGDVVSVHAEVAEAASGDEEVLHGQTAVTEFAVNPANVVVPDFEGYGAQMNGYLYTAQNDPKKGTGNLPPQDLTNVETKVRALKPGLVRIFLSPAAYLPANQNLMDSFYKTVELAQSAGSNVNITWWFIDRAAHDDPVVQQQLMQQDMQEFAATLVDLVTNHGLTAVKQITIQNEVNTSWVKPQLYEQYYRLLDQLLRSAGIRDHIKFVGGDLVINNQLTWFNYMAANMGDVLDGWSVHIYWNYWDTEYMGQRLNGILSIYNSILPEKRKPLSITEYGVRGVKTANGVAIKVADPYKNGALVAVDPGMYQDAQGNETPISETNLAGFEQAWFNMLSVNDGFTGMSKWDMFRAQYDFGYQDYSLIGYVFNPASGEDQWPLRPSYGIEWLMANTSGQHWRVVGYSGTSTVKVITPLLSPTGDFTIFALSSDQAASSVSLGNLPAGTEFRMLVWNADGLGKVSDGGRVNTEGTGTLTVSVPAGSLVALTSMAGKERLCGYQTDPCSSFPASPSSGGGAAGQ